MKTKILPIVLLSLVFLTSTNCKINKSPILHINDQETVEKIIHDLTAWALNKDFERLDSIVTHDSDLFYFQQKSTGDIKGYEAFKGLYKWWKDPKFKATSYDLRDLRIVFSQSGDVAWYSAYLDDCLEWDGKPFCLNDTRWTGVLEKRGGEWVIVQMHYSFASDKVIEDYKKEKSN